VVAARVLALSPRFDLALIKVPKTLGLAAVFPRSVTAAVNDMMFAAAYDTLPDMMTRGDVLANATVAKGTGRRRRWWYALGSIPTGRSSGYRLLR
jgi:hypothetical protein